FSRDWSSDVCSSDLRQETALLHRAERWRERLLAEGDAALAELLDAHPDADRQKLRQLVRSALDEQARNKPPRAFRELFKLLRGMLAQERGSGMTGHSSVEDGD